MDKVESKGTPRLLEAHRLNYLHFGHALSDLAVLCEDFEDDVALARIDFERELRRRVTAKHQRLFELLDVLRFVAGPSGFESVGPLREVLAQGLRWQALFRSLGCRGFSFRVCEDPMFHHCNFSAEVNYKFALLADQSLYFPPKVRASLRTAIREQRHVRNSIGWFLVMEKSFDQEKWWYIVNVQSDAMSSSVSCLKEVFRGWHRVLFGLMLGIAQQRGVAAIAIPSAEVMAGLDGNGQVEPCRLKGWYPLYDGIAEFFSMSETSHPYPMNVQALWFNNPRWCSRYYQGRVATLIDGLHA